MVPSGYNSWPYALIQLFLIVAWAGNSAVGENVANPVILDINAPIEGSVGGDSVTPTENSSSTMDVGGNSESIAMLTKIASNIESIDCMDAATEQECSGRTENSFPSGDKDGEDAAEEDTDNVDDDEDELICCIYV